MPKTIEKTIPKVSLKIVPGKPTPAMKSAWNKFWQKLIVDVKGDDHAEKKDD